MSIEKKKDTVVYPFIDELVEALCTTETKNFIRKHVTSESDKQTMMMFLFLYFGVELKLMDTNAESVDRLVDKLDNNTEHKTGLKYILSEIINDPVKRRACVKMFSEKMGNMFLEN